MNLGNLLKKFIWAFKANRIVSDLPDSLICIDKKGIIKYVNNSATALFQMNHQEGNDTSINDIIESGISCISQSIKENKPVLAIAYTNGVKTHVELTAKEIWNGCCVSIRNITALTKEIFNEEKTNAFNNEKNAMLSVLEEDLKSPITSIIGFSNGLLDGMGGELSEKQMKYIKIIENNAQEYYNFIDKLIEFSKVESSIYKINYHQFDIVETCRNTIKDFTQIFKNKNIDFEFNFETLEKYNIYSDSQAISFIISNILDIANAMTSSGAISFNITNLDKKTCALYNIDVEKCNSYIHFSIIDTGCGIAQEEMKYLCKPYGQLKTNKKNFVRALALGTSSILIKRLEGYMNIKSEVGRGTRYDFIIPIEKDKNE